MWQSNRHLIWRMKARCPNQSELIFTIRVWKGWVGRGGGGVWVGGEGMIPLS